MSDEITLRLTRAQILEAMAILYAYSELHGRPEQIVELGHKLSRQLVNQSNPLQVIAAMQEADAALAETKDWPEVIDGGTG